MRREFRVKSGNSLFATETGVRSIVVSACQACTDTRSDGPQVSGTGLVAYAVFKTAGTRPRLVWKVRFLRRSCDAG